MKKYTKEIEQADETLFYRTTILTSRICVLCQTYMFKIKVSLYTEMMGQILNASNANKFM